MSWTPRAEKAKKCLFPALRCRGTWGWGWGRSLHSRLLLIHFLLVQNYSWSCPILKQPYQVHTDWQRFLASGREGARSRQTKERGMDSTLSYFILCSSFLFSNSNILFYLGHTSVSFNWLSRLLVGPYYFMCLLPVLNKYSLSHWMNVQINNVMNEWVNIKLGLSLRT